MPGPLRWAAHRERGLFGLIYEGVGADAAAGVPRSGDSLRPPSASRVFQHCQSRVGKIWSLVYSRLSGGECWDGSVSVCATRDALSDMAFQLVMKASQGGGAAGPRTRDMSGPKRQLCSRYPQVARQSGRPLPARSPRGPLCSHSAAVVVAFIVGCCAFPQTRVFQRHFTFSAFKGRFEFGTQPVGAH